MEPTRQSHYLQQIDATRNRARWYEAHLLPLPCGCWRLQKRWGRIGAKRLSEKEAYYIAAEAELAAKTLGKLLRQKRRRGYVDADPGHLRAKKKPPGPGTWGQLVIEWG